MKRLKSVAGDENLSININDLNEDFDPKEYDRRMKVQYLNFLFYSKNNFFYQELFNDDYYQQDRNEEDKPEVSDEELQGIKIYFIYSSHVLEGFFLVENWDRTDEEIIPKPVQSNNQEEQLTKKSKKKSKLRQAIAQSKPTFDPSIRKNYFIFEKSNFNFFFQKKNLSNNILMNIINLIVKILLVICQFDFNIDKLNQMILV